MGGLAKIEPELIKLGYQVIAISPDKPEKIAGVMKKTKAKYTLVSDSDATAAKAFGLAWRVGPEMREKLKSFGINLEEASGKTHHLLPVPAAYVIDTKGVIQFAYVHPDHAIRVSHEVLLAAAKVAIGK